MLEEDEEYCCLQEDGATSHPSQEIVDVSQF